MFTKIGYQSNGEQSNIYQNNGYQINVNQNNGYQCLYYQNYGCKILITRVPKVIAIKVMDYLLWLTELWLPKL